MADNRSFPDITFVESDTKKTEDEMIQKYELLTGRTLYPADPIRLLIAWAADIEAQSRGLTNESAKQNVPRYAEGDKLDSLSEIFRDVERLGPQAATTTLRFTLSETRPSAVNIPLGTRATVDGEIVFATTEIAQIDAGSLYADVAAECQTLGPDGNGYAPGQIATAVDVLPYMQSVTNTTTSEGGADTEGDEEFYNRMRESVESYSTAGPSGAYEYIAKSVNPQISDAKAVSRTELVFRELEVNGGKAYKGGDQLLTATLEVFKHGTETEAVLGTDYAYTYEDGLLTISITEGGLLDGDANVDIAIFQEMAGRVNVCVLLKGGELPGPEILQEVEAAISAQTKRPLTDHVTASAPATTDYNIDLTYYIPLPSAASAAVIQASVEAAVEEYKDWQSSKMGRDVNPSYLEYLLMKTGIKRVVIRAPVHNVIDDGGVATLNTESVVYGGIEDE